MYELVGAELVRDGLDVLVHVLVLPLVAFKDRIFFTIDITLNGLLSATLSTFEHVKLIGLFLYFSSLLKFLLF